MRIKIAARQLAKWLTSLFWAIQPQRWTKQLIIYAALVFDGKLFQPNLLLRTTLLVFAFCLAAGSIPLLYQGLSIDRLRQRPPLHTRSGVPLDLSILPGVALFVLLGLGIATWLDLRVGLVAAAYLLVNALDYLYFKTLVIIDVLVSALSLLLEMFAGVLLVDVQQFSPWLYVCVTLLALFWGFGQRRHELLLHPDAAPPDHSTLLQYNLPLIDQIMSLVTASLLITYTLYTFSASTALAGNGRLLLTVPFVFYFVVRYFYLVYVKKMGSPPDELLWQDKPLLVNSLAWLSAVVGLIYIR